MAALKVTGDAKTGAKPELRPRDRNTHPETQKPLLFACVEREEEDERGGVGQRCSSVTRQSGPAKQRQ